MTDIRRTLLWVVFTMSLVLLWDAWNKHTGQPSMFGLEPARPAATAGPAPAASPSATGVPSADAGRPLGSGAGRGRDHARRRGARPRASAWPSPPT